MELMQTQVATNKRKREAMERVPPTSSFKCHPSPREKKPLEDLGLQATHEHVMLPLSSSNLHLVLRHPFINKNQIQPLEYRLLSWMMVRALPTKTGATQHDITFTGNHSQYVVTLKWDESLDPSWRGKACPWREKPWPILPPDLEICEGASCGKTVLNRLAIWAGWLLRSLYEEDKTNLDILSEAAIQALFVFLAQRLQCMDGDITEIDAEVPCLRTPSYDNMPAYKGRCDVVLGIRSERPIVIEMKYLRPQEINTWYYLWKWRRGPRIKGRLDAKNSFETSLKFGCRGMTVEEYIDVALQQASEYSPQGGPFRRVSLVFAAFHAHLSKIREDKTAEEIAASESAAKRMKTEHSGSSSSSSSSSGSSDSSSSSSMSSNPPTSNSSLAASEPDV